LGQRAIWSGFAVCLLTALSIQSLGLVEPLERLLIDAEFRLLKRIAPRQVGRDVVVVGIDDETFEALPEPHALWHPYLASFLEAMESVQPRIVGMDVVLPAKSYEGVVKGYDRRLQLALLRFRKKIPLVIGRTIDTDGNLRPIEKRLLITAGGDAATGNTLMPRDSDAVVRRFDDRITRDRGLERTLAGRMAEYLGIDPGHGLIDFSTGTPFTYIPLHSVLDWHSDGNRQRLADAFAGQIVLLGPVLRFDDRHRVPINIEANAPNNNGYVPGVMIQAQALRSLLNGGLIQDTPRIWSLALCAAAATLWFAGGSSLGALITPLVWVLALAGAATWLMHTGIHLPVSGALVAGGLSLVARLIGETVKQLTVKRRMRSVFSGYVSPQIMDKILAGNLDTGLATQKRRVCLLFSDIREFTNMSESMEPEQVTTLLNRYFEEMTAAIHGNQGTIDKFMGDGIMAFFGAPADLDRPVRAAVDAAKEMLLRLDALNEALRAEGSRPLAIGIGLHVGDAVVGHVGSSTRHEYTAIGDAVNTTSRLEGLTKKLGYPLLCTDAVHAELAGSEQLEGLGHHAVKGRAAIAVYGWPPRHEEQRSAG
jgi:class 3 adenylate cyclase/CHASE2 domain-containing sensor protein